MSLLSEWFIHSTQATSVLPMHHHHGLVLLSVLVAIVTSIMALQIAGLARLSRTRSSRHLAIGTGALAMGGGIWAMHFIGMLAMLLPVEFSYSPILTFLSMLPGLIAAWIALALLSQQAPGKLKLISGGVFMGAGIGLMHYSGMAAIEMQPALRYDPWLFGLSIIVAVVLAILALWVRYGLKGRVNSITAIAAGGSVMGIAISSMHYTGMSAARVIGVAEYPLPQSMQDSVYLAGMITMATLSFSVLVAAANSLLRYRDLYRQHLADQRRTEAVLNTAIDGIIIIDDRGTIRNVNPSVVRLFGWATHELIGQNIRMLMPEPHQSNHDGYLADYKRHGQAKIIGVGREVEALHKDGNRLHIRLAIGRAELPGEVLYVGFITDISERKSMEEAIQKSEQQYRSLISNIPGVAFRNRIDDQLSTLFISDGIETITGYPASDFIERRKYLTELYHPVDLKPTATAIQEAIARRQHYSVEYRVIDLDGKEHWILEYGSVVMNEHNQPAWLDGIMLDQTDTKLRNAEYQSKMTAISKAVLLIEFSMDRRILAVNDNFIDCMGYSREEMTGKTHALFCSEEQLNSQEYTGFWKALRRGEYRSGEFCRYDKNGNPVWLQATYNPILDANGYPFKVLKLAIDVTHRRLMEEELRTARDRAEEAAAARSSFLANMSHEIRTPMNAIIGFTELLLDSPLNPQQQRQLRTVYQSSSSLLGLLNDILDTAKLDKGAVELERLDFSLPELCQQVCDSHQLSADKKGLGFRLNYQVSGAEFFQGDPLRLRQILNNLIGNAIKFTEKGQVELRVSGNAGAVRFDIRDTGIGIAADRLNRIFDPFSQADASMSRRFGGTGLGTTISRQLVELMQGRIHVSSTPGEGSTFSVEIPLPAGQRHPRPLTRNTLPVLPPLNILVADDVPQNLELLQINLEKMGHQVTTVQDGFSAVSAYQKQPFDLIIMDVQMPGMDGLEASRIIRDLGESGRQLPVPVIALTASVLDRDRQEALEAGMHGFATKPLNMPALVSEMARLLNIDVSSPESSAVRSAATFTDDTQALALWGNATALHHARQKFLQENHRIADTLRTAIDQQHWQNVLADSHRLFGLCGNLGLTTLSTIFAECENAARQQNHEAGYAVLERIAQAFHELEKSLTDTVLTTVKGTDSAVGEPADRNRLLHEYDDIIRALNNSSIDKRTTEYLNELGKLHPAAAEAIRAEIDDFNFANAVHLLQTIMVTIREDHP